MWEADAGFFVYVIMRAPLIHAEGFRTTAKVPRPISITSHGLECHAGLATIYHDGRRTKTQSTC